MFETTKICTVCGKQLPLTAFAHSRGSRAKYGRRGDCKTCHNEKAKERRSRNPVKWEGTRRACHLRWQFNMTQDDYDKMFARQNGCCAICGQPETAKRAGRVIWLAVDHNHKTGEVRELLCGNCNKVLGWLGEDVNRCYHMAAYITRHNKR